MHLWGADPKHTRLGVVGHSLDAGDARGDMPNLTRFDAM